MFIVPSVEFPRFLIRPRNTTAVVDESVWLHCNATGNPKPKISWTPTKDDRFIQHANGTLQIKNLRLKDGGKYYCIAANKFKMKQATIILRVKRGYFVTYKEHKQCSSPGFSGGEEE